jgi:hypothetical protein
MCCPCILCPYTSVQLCPSLCTALCDTLCFLVVTLCFSWTTHHLSFKYVAPEQSLQGHGHGHGHGHGVFILATHPERKWTTVTVMLTVGLVRQKLRHSQSGVVVEAWGKTCGRFWLCGFYLHCHPSVEPLRFVHAVSLRGNRPSAAPGGSCGLTYVPGHSIPFARALDYGK